MIVCLLACRPWLLPAVQRRAKCDVAVTPVFRQADALVLRFLIMHVAFGVCCPIADELVRVCMNYRVNKLPAACHILVLGLQWGLHTVRAAACTSQW